jgi:hypothetical protein
MRYEQSFYEISFPLYVTFYYEENLFFCNGTTSYKKYSICQNVKVKFLRMTDFFKFK